LLMVKVPATFFMGGLLLEPLKNLLSCQYSFSVIVSLIYM
jgi:hypothetical protein